jgi:hypothetical protein
MPPVVCPLCTLYLEATGELDIMNGRLLLREITCHVDPNITHVNGLVIAESKRAPMSWGMESSPYSLINRVAVFERPVVPKLSSIIEAPIKTILDSNTIKNVNCNISQLSSEFLSTSVIQSSPSSIPVSNMLSTSILNYPSSNSPRIGPGFNLTDKSTPFMPNQVIKTSNPELINENNISLASYISSSSNNNSNNSNNNNSNNNNNNNNHSTNITNSFNHVNADAPMLLSSESLSNLPAIFQHRLFDGLYSCLSVSNITNKVGHKGNNGVNVIDSKSTINYKLESNSKFSDIEKEFDYRTEPRWLYIYYCIYLFNNYVYLII